MANLRRNDQYMADGQRFSIVQLDTDRYEVESDKGKCSGFYNGYVAACAAASAVARGAEHLIDQIDNGEPLQHHQLLGFGLEVFPID